MDAVSYSLASKQAQRIEKFIENPDSASGIVTTPKTIASGETVTIPSGRVAVLPNTIVEGNVVVEAGGEIFVPAGSTYGNRVMYEKINYIATQGQTVFSVNYDLGSVDVYVNGIRLANTDFEATSLTSVTIAGGLNAGDIVELVSFGAFTVADTYTKAETDNKIALADVFVVNDTRAKTALNASGDAPIYACRAWVNFNGTGTVAIRASGNVSSITDNGVGDYTVNFTTAMPDVNYSPSGSCSIAGNTDGNNTPILTFGSSGITSTSSLQVRTPNNNPLVGGYTDMATVTVSICR